MVKNTPYADLLPPLSTEEFEALKADIKANGVRTPIDVDEDGNVLDGHHRLKIKKDCTRRIVRGLSEAEKQAYVFRANFLRRNLTKTQKAEAKKAMKAVAKMLRKDDLKKYTHKAIAETLGIARRTVADWFEKTITNGDSAVSYKPPDSRTKVPTQAHGDIVDRLAAGDKQEQVAADYGVSQAQISHIATKERKQQEKKKERAKAIKAIGKAKLPVWHGRFQKIGDRIEDASVDLIFTDPPYGKDDVPQYGDLAEFAARVLKPGAWCLTYAGQHFLPEILNLLTAHLSYGWMFAAIHDQGDLRFRKFKLRNHWKPIIGLYKPPLDVWWDWFVDIPHGTKDKDNHEWQQPLGHASHFIKSLCPEKGLVVDCFMGSGTTGVAAKQLNRACRGFEEKKDDCDNANVRINAA